VASPVPRTPQLQSLAAAMIRRQNESLAILGTKTYGVTECSACLGIDRATFRRWLHTGLVAFSRTGPRGRIRVSESELKRLLGKTEKAS
jgi:excisionase family DNA binding protein